MATLYIVAEPELEGQANRLATQLEEAWPGKVRPFLGVGTVEQTIERLIAGGIDAGIVVLVDAQTPAIKVDMIVDQIVRQRLPAIVIGDVREGQKSVESAGVLVETWETPIPSIAIALDALLRRQGAMRDVAREAKMASASAHGLAEELRHVHEELEIAASVQRDILPKGLPIVDGLDGGLLFRPAGQVSGDIYDMTILDDGRVSLFIADAVGHGMPAALLTMMVAHHLAKCQLGADSVPPARVLHELNQAMCERRFSTPRFATAVYCVIDPATGEATIAGAGHPPALRINGGVSTPIESAGPLLGIFEDAAFEEASLTLEIGETLALYSDGFESAFPDDKLAEDGRPLPGADYVLRLRDILGGGRDVSEAVADLEGRVDEQAGSLHQADDLTALVVRRVACAARAIAA